MGNFVEVKIDPTTKDFIMEAPRPNLSGGMAQMHMSYDAASGQVFNTGPVSINASDLSTGLTGILSTAKSPAGGPATEIKPGTLVTVNGMQMTVEGAVYAGLLTKTPDGRFIEAATPPPKEEVPTEAAPVQEEAPMSQEGQQYIQAVYETMGQAKAEQMMNTYINNFDGDHGHALETFARENGYEPEHITKIVSRMGVPLQNQAVAYVSKKTGENGTDILKWAREEFSAEALRQVFRLHALGKDMRGYDAIIREYNKAKK